MARVRNTGGRERLKKWVMMLWVMLMATSVGCSCTRTVYLPKTEIKEVAFHDTIERYHYRTDTVMMRDSVVDIHRGDTIRKEIWRWRERVRVRVDTVQRVHRDTLIIYQQQVVSERASEKTPLKRWKRGWIIVGIIILLIFAVWIYNKITDR